MDEEGVLIVGDDAVAGRRSQEGAVAHRANHRLSYIICSFAFYSYCMALQSTRKCKVDALLGSGNSRRRALATFQCRPPHLNLCGGSFNENST